MQAAGGIRQRETDDSGEFRSGAQAGSWPYGRGAAGVSHRFAGKRPPLKAGALSASVAGGRREMVTEGKDC